MNRYLLSFVVGALALLAFLSVGNRRELLQRAGDASRESISANPSSAAETANLTGIESAGENVLRQTSPEAIERSPNLTETSSTSTTSPQFSDSTPPAATDPTQRPTNATPPVPPSSVPPATPTPQPAPVPPADQEPIPALW